MNPSEILLLRIPPELIRKTQTLKEIPLPNLDVQIPRNVGFCTHDGLKLIAKVAVLSTGKSFDIIEHFDRLNQSEYYRFVGSSATAAICRVDQILPDKNIAPGFFMYYPKYEGDYSLTISCNLPLLNFIKSEQNPDRTAKPPKPSAKGILSDLF